MSIKNTTQLLDYHLMTDLELNKLIAIAINLDIFEYTNEMDQNKIYLRVGKEYTYGCPTWNPCNSITDAWPIIQTIFWELLLSDKYGTTVWGRHMRHEDDSDKLRAAMIVFLKLKENRDV